MSEVKEWHRILLTIAYDGAEYYGWQRQPFEGQTSVEAVIEEHIARIYNQEVRIYGQGRTDAGVHALGQTAHIDLPTRIPLENLLKALNSILPPSIAIMDAEVVEDDFHARFDATEREYEYALGLRPNPLLRKRQFQKYYNLNLDVLDWCAAQLLGEHDFGSFAFKSDDKPNKKCIIYESAFERIDDHNIIYKIRGNRFLRRMVRRLVGTMVMTAMGRRTKEDFTDLIQNPKQDERVYTAPGHALVLKKVYYKKS